MVDQGTKQIDSTLTGPQSNSVSCWQSLFTLQNLEEKLWESNDTSQSEIGVLLLRCQINSIFIQGGM